MKQLLITCVMMALCCHQAMAQMKTAQRYAPTYNQETYQDDEMVKVGKGWASRPIKVKKGGKTPGVVTLTCAFNEVWGVPVVKGILRQAANPKFTRAYDKEYDSETIVDRKNGYMCEDSGGTDSDYMSSCVWRRDNGHRLFAICIGSPTDPEIEVICFYDYDPATETMTPEQSPADTFQKKHEFYSYALPHKGKDFIIREYDLATDEEISHHFTWDGQKHVYGYDTKKPMK